MVTVPEVTLTIWYLILGMVPLQPEALPRTYFNRISFPVVVKVPTWNV